VEGKRRRWCWWFDY